MLELPEKGISTSSTKHNCDMIAVADWAISSAMFSEQDISKTDLVDALMDNQVYSKQDFCNQFIDQVWYYLEHFFNNVELSSIALEPRKIRFLDEWRSDLALAYCLTASLRKIYSTWSKEHCGNHLIQGAILEELTKISLSNCHPALQFRTTGWSGAGINPKFEDLVNTICAETNFTQKDLALWNNGHVKDLGLDVYGYLPGHGARPGTHFMMYQCASGDNWQDKRSTPDLNIWGDIIKTYTTPIRGMSIPFFVDEIDFQQSLLVIKGPLLDRTTLLSRIVSDQIPPELGQKIEQWVSERVDKLQYYD
ncbi:hypothetical protein [Stutzerimonas stutzeri]|uniref:hypothetical protein n=1 Tax=Stutzerimonas stutzeri TaxID=316 RepID=UPI001CFDC3D5|nr:hypothetical protein [Stutzerimonas stutzeri]